MSFEFDKMSINGTIINAKDLDGRDLISALDLTVQNAKETAENAAETANQAMIDTAAQDGRIGNIEQIISAPLIIVRSYSYEYTIPASSFVMITKEQLGMTLPSGYQPLGMMNYGTGNGNVLLRAMSGFNDNVYLKNLSANAITATFTISYSFVKSGAIGG